MLVLAFRTYPSDLIDYFKLYWFSIHDNIFANLNAFVSTHHKCIEELSKQMTRFRT